MKFGDGPSTPIYLGDVHIPYAKEYKYLGGIVNPLADWKDDFAKRKKQAWYLIRRFRDVWECNVSQDTKRRLFQALIIPVLTYAAPLYPLTKTMYRHLHVTCNSLLRCALNTPANWKNPELHAHTEELYGPMPTLPASLAYQTVNAFGHYVRHTPDSPVVGVLAGEVTVRNKRTHTRLNPRKNLERLTGLDFDHVLDMAYESKVSRHRDRYNQLSCDAALRIEEDIFIFALKRRRGGPLNDRQHSEILLERANCIKAWWQKVTARKSMKKSTAL